MALDEAIEKSLKTWYPKDHPLHLDPLHPALGLAGEAGELLDLYKKERFKDGVSWWDCVKCKASKLAHEQPTMIGIDRDGVPYYACDFYTPKVLDELGDAWYYMRILAYQLELPIATPLLQTYEPDTVFILSQLNMKASLLLEAITLNRKGGIVPLMDSVNYWFFMLLRKLDFTLDQVTESNWQKLKDGDNHGWKEARQSQR